MKFLLTPPGWSGWLLSGVEATAAVAAAVLGVLVGLPVPKGETRPVWWIPTLLVAGVVAVVLPFLRQAIRRWRAQTELSTIDRLHVSLTLYLEPALRLLTRMVTEDATARRATLETLQYSIADAAAHLCGPDGNTLQVNYFAARGRTLSPAAHSQTTNPSTRVFTNHVSDPAGKEAWAHAKTGQPALWPDIEDPSKRPVHYSRSPSTAYRTFITIGVVKPSTETVWGMLNVDAPQPGDLGLSDMRLLQVLASLLATGHAAASRP